MNVACTVKTLVLPERCLIHFALRAYVFVLDNRFMTHLERVVVRAVYVVCLRCHAAKCKRVVQIRGMLWVEVKHQVPFSRTCPLL